MPPQALVEIFYLKAIPGRNVDAGALARDSAHNPKYTS
jgi:hypothetical protein